jgi:hypothetical protein
VEFTEKNTQRLQQAGDAQLQKDAEALCERSFAAKDAAREFPFQLYLHSTHEGVRELAKPAVKQAIPQYLDENELHDLLYLSTFGGLGERVVAGTDPDAERLTYIFNAKSQSNQPLETNNMRDLLWENLVKSVEVEGSTKVPGTSESLLTVKGEAILKYLNQKHGIPNVVPKLQVSYQPKVSS